MAHYIRFEIYIPLVYRVREPDPKSGRLRWATHSVDDEKIEAFIDDTREKYHGITQVNPLGPGFKGWWQAKPRSQVSVDYLTCLFGLVRIDSSDEGKKHFRTWKASFEDVAHQEVVLVMYYSVQTLGDFV